MTTTNEAASLINLAPTAVKLSNIKLKLAENVSTLNPIRLADINVTDDGIGSTTLSLSGVNASFFVIENNALYLKAGSVLNYEAKTSYTVKVNAFDSTVAGSTPVSVNYKLNITNINEAPTGVVLSNVVSQIAENTTTTVPIKVADIAIKDDALGSVNLSLAGANAARFTIDGNALYLKAGVALNYETIKSYAVTVKAFDSSVIGSIAVSTNYKLNVTNVNEPPTALVLSNVTSTLNENTDTIAPIKVGNIAIIDDALGSETLSITGADAHNFEIVSNTLYLKAGVVLDFESKANYAITINAVDNALIGSTPVSNNYSLSLNNLNEAPTAVKLNNSKLKVAENTNMSARLKVADIAITDDNLGSVSYSLSGANASRFSIDGNALYLKAGTALNFEAKKSYAVTVNAFDSSLVGSAAVSTNYKLNVTNVNEAPTALILTNTINTIAENTNTSARIKVANITIIDDALGTETLSLTGTDANQFIIDGNILYLKAGSVLDYESKSNYAITVSAVDSNLIGSLPVSAQYNLTLTDVDEISPTLLSASVNGDKMNLNFSETLNSTGIAPLNSFIVISNGLSNAVTNITVNNNILQLTLTNRVKNGESVTVTYIDPSPNDDNNAIQDGNGNDTVNIINQAVTNLTEIPTFSVTTTSGTLSFNGTATGTITVNTNANNVATFSREGITAITTPDLDNISNINLASGQTLSASAAQMTGKTIIGAGSIDISASHGDQTIKALTTGTNSMTLGEGRDTVVVDLASNFGVISVSDFVNPLATGGDVLRILNVPGLTANMDQHVKAAALADTIEWVATELNGDSLSFKMKFNTSGILELSNLMTTAQAKTQFGLLLNDAVLSDVNSLLTNPFAGPYAINLISSQLDALVATNAITADFKTEVMLSFVGGITKSELTTLFDKALTHLDTAEGYVQAVNVSANYPDPLIEMVFDIFSGNLSPIIIGVIKGDVDFV